MKYILTNLKNFAVKNTMIFILFVVCEIADVLIRLFSHGVFQNFQASKDVEKMKDDVFGYTLCFGEIIDTQKDENGNVMYYFGSDSITLSQLRSVLDKLDEETKSSLPGMYFNLRFSWDESEYIGYFEPDDSGEIVCPMSAVRIEYDEELNDYSLYNTYVKNISLRKGRYFTKEEYASSDNLVVLPVNAKDELLGQNIQIFGKSYKVIGILGDNAMHEFQVPYKTLGDNFHIYDIGFLDNNALDTKSFSNLKKAFEETLDCSVNYPPVETVDLSDIKFYNSIIYISVAVAVASAINLAMLFRFVIRSRSRQTSVFCCAAVRETE